MNPLLFAGAALATEASLQNSVIRFDDTDTEVQVDADGLSVVADNKHPEIDLAASGLVIGSPTTCSSTALVSTGKVELVSTCAGAARDVEVSFYDDATELVLDNGARVVVEATALSVEDATGTRLLEEEGIYFVGGMPTVITTSNFKVEIEGVTVAALTVDEPGTLKVDSASVEDLKLSGTANVVTLSASTVDTLTNTGSVGSLQLDGSTLGSLDDQGSIRSTTTTGGSVIIKGPPVKR